MAIVRSDNRLEQHPKPAQAYERKLSGGVYVDWADQAEINAAYSIYYRPNKYFWINGAYYHCANDGVTYIAVGAAVASTWLTIGYEGTTFDCGLIGNVIKMIIRGPSGAPKIVTSGPPTGTQIFYDNTTGILEVISGNDWFPGEEISILYI